MRALISLWLGVAVLANSAADLRGERSLQPPAVRADVQNLRATVLGTAVQIDFDIVSDVPGATFGVQLEVSDDGGKTYGTVARTVSGHHGKGVGAGASRRIIWEATRDTEQVDLGSFGYRIRLTPEALPTPTATAPVAPPVPPPAPAPAQTAEKGGSAMKWLLPLGGAGVLGGVLAATSGGGPPDPPGGTTTSGTTTANRAPTVGSITVSPTGIGIDSATVFTFGVQGASDPDGDALTFSWDFGDGSGAGPSASMTKTYTRSGSFDVSVRITDGRGGVVIASSPGLRISTLTGTWDVTLVPSPNNVFRDDMATRVTLAITQQTNQLAGTATWVDKCGATQTSRFVLGTITTPRQVSVGIESWGGAEVRCGNGLGVDTYFGGSMNETLSGMTGSCNRACSTFSMTKR